MHHAMQLANTESETAVPKVNGRRRHKHKPGNEHLCKYASKACYEHRVAKTTGELHRYCEHHRLQANRNQRRLEQRRRVQAMGLLDTTTYESHSDNSSYTSDEFKPYPRSRESRRLGTVITVCNTPLGESSFEPFQYPVPLREEDVSSLQWMLS